MENKTVNQRIESLMWQLRLSQNGFAREIGLSPTGVNKIVKGLSNPGADVLHSIVAKFPNVNPSWLLTGEGAMFLDMHSKVDDGSPQLSKTVVTEEGNLLDEIRGMREDFRRLMAVIESQAELLKKRTGNSKKRAGKVLELGLPLGYLAA